ncbi:PIG-L deacetylase family protein [Gephyromycinifex aptenodytis]|uniref:PIG-L deacetylase family protein n=1 Tax=Gephyromycinifex aptenodytis TaxID=2716227 RepID=UPI00144642C3|nr:PIG-L family deacetylase [Gephyromycinifex aptenodytis]
MLALNAVTSAGPRSVLAVGAHCDDIEIGAGATLHTWARLAPETRFTFVVMTSTPQRAREARNCLRALVEPATSDVVVHELRDTRLPGDYDRVKDILAELAQEPWDLVLTHQRFDAHQDHRLLGELAPTAFRDHLVWQFEIPKWDGDLGTSQANLYVPLTQDAVAAKWAALDEHYVSQRGKDWWDEETFAALARLRGMECRQRYAEAFRCEKAVVDLALP